MGACGGICRVIYRPGARCTGVARHAYPEILPRVESRLTASGQQALPMLDGIVAFGKAHP